SASTSEHLRFIHDFDDVVLFSAGKKFGGQNKIIAASQYPQGGRAGEQLRIGRGTDAESAFQGGAADIHRGTTEVEHGTSHSAGFKIAADVKVKAISAQRSTLVIAKTRTAAAGTHNGEMVEQSPLT